MTDTTDSSERLGGAVSHAVECDDCGGGTFMYERFCHRCGNDRWDE